MLCKFLFIYFCKYTSGPIFFRQWKWFPNSGMKEGDVSLTNSFNTYFLFISCTYGRSTLSFVVCFHKYD